MGHTSGTNREQLHVEPLDSHQRAAIQNVVALPGMPLGPTLRARLEARFNRDLSHVRVHTGPLAADSVHSLRASAYSTGFHIVFGDDQYRPDTTGGLNLIVHEVAHVLQNREISLPPRYRTSSCDHPLETAAVQAARIIATGRTLPETHELGIAPGGLVQCHPGPPCVGFSSLADTVSIRYAEVLLEKEYMRTLIDRFHVVLRRSQEYQWPPDRDTGGAQYQAYVNELVGRMRALPLEERPNILDLLRHKAYFFWRDPVPVRVVQIINAFHRTEDGISRRHRQPRWDSTSLPHWFPDHIILFENDPTLKRSLCTSMTDHNPFRGLIRYNILQEKKPRRAMRRAMQYRVIVDQPVAELGPMVEQALPKTIQVFNPEYPDYVLIVPRAYYRTPHMQQRAQMDWRLMTGKAPFFNQIVTTRTICLVIAFGAVAGVWSSARFAAMAAPTVGQTAGVTASTSLNATAHTARAGNAAIVEVKHGMTAAGQFTTIPAGGVATGGGAAATGVEVMAIATQSTLFSSAAARAIASSAGALLILGGISNAEAASSKGAVPPVLDDLMAVRAIPINDFQSIGGMLQGFSLNAWHEYRETAAPSKGEFGMGRFVRFDHEDHVIIGHVTIQ